MATVAIVHSSRMSVQDALARTKTALATRNVIEQAKGALAYREQIDMAAGYERLKRIAHDSETSLSHTARGLIQDAQNGAEQR
jgi:AmiR/NasT family two-component response regulator